MKSKVQVRKQINKLDSLSNPKRRTEKLTLPLKNPLLQP